MKIILLVDDDPDILASTASLLKKRGFDVIEAQDAETALEILRGQRPDLIVTDVLLPKMNGYEFVKEVKSGVFTADIPVLVMTGRGQMKESFEAAGVNAFIQKPFSPDALMEKIIEITGTDEIAKNSQTRFFRKILILGRRGQLELLNDIENLLTHSGCTVTRVYSVSDGIAKTIEEEPDAFVVDVQLDGKHASEFVMIVRRLPGCEHKPIVGFCYYDINNLGDAEYRKQVTGIDHDSEQFLKNGADTYIGRYSGEALIAALKETSGAS